MTQLVPRPRALDMGMLACGVHWLGRVSKQVGRELTDSLDGGGFLVEGLRHDFGWRKEAVNALEEKKFEARYYY